MTSSYIYSFLSLVLAGLANYGSSYILSHLTFDQQPANDILLFVIPRIQWMGYAADTVLILATLTLLYSYRKSLSKLPSAIYSISIVLFIRSLLILLTPINNSFGRIEYWDLFSFSSYPSGMFPSGHTAFTYLCYLLLKDNPNKIYSKISLSLLILEIIALISSHGHYSIDIVGGLMLAYIVYRLGKDYQNRSKDLFSQLPQ